MNVDDIFVSFFQFQLTNTSSIYHTSISFTPFEQSPNQKGICHSSVAIIICFVTTYFHGRGGGGGRGGAAATLQTSTCRGSGKMSNYIPLLCTLN